MIEFTFIVILVLLAISFANSRSIRDDSDLISNGMDQTSQPKILQLENMTTLVTCEPTYGFLPCSTKVWGNLFLLVVYEYLLSLSEKYISMGSNLFFDMFGTGIFGGSLFYILGMFPQVLLVLVSSISTSADTIRSVAAMSMGLVAGTTITNLTIIWGSVIAFGSCNLPQTSVSTNLENERPSFFTGFGVRTDILTKYTARIMLLSIFPFLLLQMANIFTSASATGSVVLTSLVVTLIFLVTYCSFQVFQPWIQNRTLEYLIRTYVQKNLLQSLCDPDGRPIKAKLRELFHKMDLTNDHQISAEELRLFLLGIETEVVGLIEESCVSKVMEEFDVSGDYNISETEFIQGMSKWLTDANGFANNEDKNEKILSHSNPKATTEKQQGLVDRKKDRMTAHKLVWLQYPKATCLILLGTAIAILLAQPLMQTFQDFATAINIPPFLVSYFVVPMALNFRQGYRAISSAKEKTEKIVSLTLSQIYGGVFMNNVLGLAIFLALVYIRDVAWDVSAEILVVVIICSAVGLSNSFFSKFPFWTSIIAYALYPISLAALYALTTVYGWG